MNESHLLGTFRQLVVTGGFDRDLGLKCHAVHIQRVCSTFHPQYPQHHWFFLDFTHDLIDGFLFQTRLVVKQIWLKSKCDIQLPFVYVQPDIIAVDYLGEAPLGCLMVEFEDDDLKPCVLYVRWRIRNPSSNQNVSPSHHQESKSIGASWNLLIPVSNDDIPSQPLLPKRYNNQWLDAHVRSLNLPLVPHRVFKHSSPTRCNDVWYRVKMNRRELENIASIKVRCMGNLLVNMDYVWLKTRLGEIHDHALYPRKMSFLTGLAESHSLAALRVSFANQRLFDRHLVKLIWQYQKEDEENICLPVPPLVGMLHSFEFEFEFQKTADASSKSKKPDLLFETHRLETVPFKDQYESLMVYFEKSSQLRYDPDNKSVSVPAIVNGRFPTFQIWMVICYQNKPCLQIPKCLPFTEKETARFVGNHHVFNHLSLTFENDIRMSGDGDFFSRVMPNMHGQPIATKYMVYQMIFHATPPICPYSVDYIETPPVEYMNRGYPGQTSKPGCNDGKFEIIRDKYHNTTCNLGRINDIRLNVSWDHDFIKTHFEHPEELELVAYCESANLITMKYGIVGSKFAA